MLNNDPRIRQAIYIVAIVAALVAIVLKPINAEWADAADNVAVYLGGIAGMTAVSNLSASKAKYEQPQ